MKRSVKMLPLSFLVLISIVFSVVPANAEMVKNKFGGSPWVAFPGNFRLTPAFPDKASRYDTFVFKPDTGDFDFLKITGEFPYARYFSFNLYDFYEATDFASFGDFEIIPDTGSINPYKIGADRLSENRSYTLFLVKEGAIVPEGAQNVMIIPEGIESLTLMARIYRPDKGNNSLGGVSQPTIEALKTDGSQANQPVTGIDMKGLQSKLRMFLFNAGIITSWNFTKKFCKKEIVFHRISDVGLFPNAHNEYVVAPLESCYLSKVAVVTFKDVPTFEDTYEGQNFEGEKEVRYWSVCTGGLAETGTPDCLCDDEIIMNDDGSVTVVIAPYYLRSRIKKAGLNYMRWGLVFKPIILHRQMMAVEDFEGKIGNVEPVDRPPKVEDRNKDYFDDHKAENWMGDYTPKGWIFSVREFKKKLSQGEFRTAF